jgi:WS/DGAT/MGAT family acyltransferase
MRQLTSLDAQFLALEGPHQAGHVGGLGVYDPSTAPNGELTFDTLMQLLKDRMHLLPPLRWKLQEVPLGLDYPYWVEDEHFDLEFHVRELALPAPGNDHQLAEQVARLHSRPLDRARPLWEMYVISELEQGHVAIYTKIHHAVIDGVSGAEIVGLLLDLTPEVSTFPDAKQPESGARISSAEMLARGLLGLPRYPLRLLRSLPRAIPHLDETTYAAIPGAARLGRLAGRLEGAVRGDGNRVVRPTLPAPKTTFNGKITPHRRFAFGQLELDRVKAVKNAFDVTLNDAVVAICAGAVRRWLVEHNELPAEPLVAQVPVSVRTEEQVGTYGNRLLMLGAPLHTEVADPVERLQVTSADLRVMKDRHKALPAQLLADANNFIPPALFSRAAKLTFSLATSGAGRPTWNLVVSNVPGPQFDLYCAGAKLLANYPVSVITDGLGLNITVMSYAGHLDIGILVDREQMPDVWNLIDWLDESLSELEAAMPRSKRGTRPRVVAR